MQIFSHSFVRMVWTAVGESAFFQHLISYGMGIVCGKKGVSVSQLLALAFGTTHH